MIQAETAIARLRRDLTVSAVIRGALLVAALASMVMEAVGRPHAIGGAGILAVIGLVWLVLSYQSVKGSRMAAVSPSLIAAGDYEQAEEAIDGALRSFSLFKSVKLRALHQLAALRHAQRRWREAAMLCRALLSAGRMTGGVTRSARLMLAEALLESGDLAGAHEAIVGLIGQRLTLAEGLELMVAQLDYLARVGQWDAMLAGARRKVEMAELLTAEKGARVYALLGLAAGRKSLGAARRWFAMRAELLADRGELVAARPMLAELWTNG